MFMLLYVRNKCHIPYSNGSLIFAIKPEVKSIAR